MLIFIICDILIIAFKDNALEVRCNCQYKEVFRRELLLDALQSAAASGRSFTDDCAAVEALGQTVSATLGSYENIKVTTPEDIAVAEAFLYRREKK